MAHEAFNVFYRARNDVTLFDDVLPALGRLHGRFRLFAITAAGVQSDPSSTALKVVTPKKPKPPTGVTLQ
jgi:hypothetical protein